MSPHGTLLTEDRSPLSVHKFDGLHIEGFDLFITDRFGGVSDGSYASLNLAHHVDDSVPAVNENRRRAAEAIGVDSNDLIFISQTHGIDVVETEHATARAVGDILSFRSPTRAAAIMVADCVPIALISPARHRAALVHAGWRGLASGVIQRAIDEIGLDEQLVAAIGPHISFEAYQVGPEVAMHFGAIENAVMSDINDRSRLDLGAVARHYLGIGGVAVTNTWSTPQVTNGGEVFFSDRAHRPCGRFAMIAKWSS